jgi:hypothetical protein
MPRRRPTSIQHVRVSSPRIAWLGFTRWLARGCKLAFLAAVVASITWAGYQGYQRVVLENPDFQLRIIDLNPNDVIDEADLVELTGLDITANLTRINTGKITTALLGHPAILDARVERHLPHTLVVRIDTREPVAWLATMESADANTPPRAPGALVVDAAGTPYPCPDLQYATARHLPRIILRQPPAAASPGTPLRHPELQQCMRLIEKAAIHAPDILSHIDTVTQPNPWSIVATTHDGTEATFSLREHPRQLLRLRAAIEHCRSRNTQLATINLIPRDNVPITLQADPPPPRAVPVPEPTRDELRRNRRSADLQSIIQRH